MAVAKATAAVVKATAPPGVVKATARGVKAEGVALLVGTNPKRRPNLACRRPRLTAIVSISQLLAEWSQPRLVAWAIRGPNMARRGPNLQGQMIGMLPCSVPAR